MVYVGEGIALAVDSVLLGISLVYYYRHKKAIKLIQAAPTYEINKNLKQLVHSNSDDKFAYVSIRGAVSPVGDPIISNNNPKVVGVVQLLITKEHVVQRNTAGYWSDSERTIQEVHNVMPFVLESNGFAVEVVDPLAAEVLDMDVIADNFEQTVPSVMDHIWGFFIGVRQRGVQNTEKMLRKGTMITGVGELVASKDGQSLKLQPPRNGTPFYLTNMQVSSLVRRLKNSKRNFRLMCYVFGGIGLIIGGLIIRRYWNERCQKLEDEKVKKQMEASRRERRKKVRDEDLPEGHLCVVCRINPREIILLPCGHVCLCEDCSLGIFDHCPVCRSLIQKKSAAYIA